MRHASYVTTLTLLSLGLISALSVSTLSAAAPNQAVSGITLHSTRVIYPGAEKGGVSYTLTNNTDDLYLLQTRITAFGDDNPDSQVTQPIVVLPPLQRFEPRESRTLRLRATDTQQLPADRESVFTLTLKAIPSQPEQPNRSVEDKADAASEKMAEPKKPLVSAPAAESGVTLQFAVQNNLKVFYRPTGLTPLTAEEVSQKLRATRQGNTVVIHNPTPYYVTFSEFSVGGKTLPTADIKVMVPPLGEQAYPLPANAQGEVRWRTLNDYGEATKAQQRPLN